MLKKAIRQFLTNRYVLLLRSKTFSIVSLLLVGTLTWSLTMIRSGIKYPFGLGFWGANGHDGIWHISLAESLREFRFTNPVFAGEMLKNYHLGFDLLLALLHKITTIPVSILYFQILPPLFAFVIGLLTYWFTYLLTHSKRSAFWATAFIYFSGSFGFIITFLRDGVFTGESMFWSQQSISTLINPPFALSLIFILAGLIALQKKKLLLSILFFGLLIQIKAYAAILVLCGLFVTSIYSYYILRTTYYIRVFVGSLILNLLLFLAVKNDSLSVFIWQPLWFLETIMSYSDRLDWTRFYSAMTTYKMGHIWVKAFLAYGVAFAIFLIGNMGVRFIGFVYYIDLIKKRVKLDEITIFVSTIIFTSILIPMLFVQNGTPWNTIQFFYYYLFFFSIFAGISISRFYYLKIIFVICAFFATWSTLQHYLPKMPQAMISTAEYEALKFLSKQPDGVVLTYPFDKYKAVEAIKNPPRPLYVYDSTAYVSAFSGKQSFEEDEVNLNIMGYYWRERRESTLKFVSTLDLKWSKEFLNSNNIKYLYLVKATSPLTGEFFKLGPADLGLIKIFENKESIIYKYDQNFGSN